MKKLLLTILFLFTTYSLSAAGTVTIANQYPSPAGIYNWLHTVATDSHPDCNDPINNTHTGRFYFDLSELRMKYCNGSAWVSLSGPWTEDTSNNIFLFGTTTQQNKKIGIGTDTPRFRLTLDNNAGVQNPDGGIFARGILGGGSNLGLLPAANRPLATPESYFIWHPKKGAIRAGSMTSAGPIAQFVFPAGQNLEWDDGWIGPNSVAFGQDTTALGENSVVSGGARNMAWSNFSVVGGGEDNKAGYYNAGNSPNWTTISGGQDNHVHSSYGFIGGGSLNIAGDNNPGGNIPTEYTTIVGGKSNIAKYNFSSIGGGYTNQIFALYSTIAGGDRNLIDSETIGTLVGGPVPDTHNFIGGGLSNNIFGSRAANIAGGDTNVITTADFGTIAGGQGNAITNGTHATIVGGTGNQANSDKSVIVGSNLITSNLATNTIAIGNPTNPTTINQADAIILLPQGNVGIGTTTPGQKLHVAGAIKLDALTVAGTPPCNNANVGIIYRSFKEALCYCGKGGQIKELDGPNGNCP